MNVADEAAKVIKSAKCKKVGADDWGLKKLAYKIDHRPEAHYYLYRIEAPPQAVSELDKKLRLMDGILRFRIIYQPDSKIEEWLDYKDYESLRRYISDRGKIRSQRMCRVSRRRMVLIVKAIKQARELALLPYVGER